MGLNPRILPPAARLDQIEYDPRLIHEGLINQGDYICPRCGHKVHFQTGDFLRHRGGERSTLDQATQAAMATARPLERDRSEYFLDFRCPGCRMAVRLVFEAPENIGISVVAVIEIE